MKLYRCDLTWTASTYVLAETEEQAERLAREVEFDHDHPEVYAREITSLDQVHEGDHRYIPETFNTNPDDMTVAEFLTGSPESEEART